MAFIRPSFIDNMGWHMAEVYGAVTDRILINLARYFPFWKPGQSVPQSSFEYQANMLAQMGQVTTDTIKIIRSMLGGADDALTNILQQSIMEAVKKAQPDLLKAVRAGLLNPTKRPVVDPSQMRAFDMYYQQAAQKLNMVNTVMLESTKQAYQATVADIAARIQVTQNALDIGAAETVTGVSSWNQALRHSIERMKNNGITGFIDHAGHKWSAEAYTAMDIRTTVANTARAAVWETNQDFGNDLYIVSYHDGARPLCYPWQNKVISASDRGGTTTDLDGNEIEIIPQNRTSYGEPAGLFGINCKHYPSPFIPGVSVLYDQSNIMSEKENKKVYEQTQQQRALERQIREQKRDLLMAKNMGADKEELRALRDKIRETDDEIDAFCKETGLPRRQSRESAFTQRSFPPEDTYDVDTFERTQKEAIDKYFNDGGSQQGYTFGQMIPKAPVVQTPTPVQTPVNMPTPIVPVQPAQQTQAVQGSATDDFVTKYLPSRKIDELPVATWSNQPTEQEIIDRIAGADKTKGSCVSVAYAYVGNKGGYNVLDFRGGDSRTVFSMNVNITKVAKFPGVDGKIESTVNDFTGAHKVLKNVKPGKQYFFRTGKHAAIVRQGANGLEYLEMQSSYRKQTWYSLDDIALDWRFGCQKSHTSYGQRYTLDNVLIDVEKLSKSPDFIEMLKYINTAEGKQQKGVGGGIK